MPLCTEMTSFHDLFPINYIEFPSKEEEEILLNCLYFLPDSY